MLRPTTNIHQVFYRSYCLPASRSPPQSEPPLSLTTDVFKALDSLNFRNRFYSQSIKQAQSAYESPAAAAVVTPSQSACARARDTGRAHPLVSLPASLNFQLMTPSAYSRLSKKKLHNTQNTHKKVSLLNFPNSVQGTV